MNKLRVFSILYKDFIVYNLIFTIWAGVILFFYRESSFPFLFWIKLFGFTFLAFIYYQSRKSRLNFYHNLGFSIKQLIMYSILIDWAITLPLFVLIYYVTA
ncbi:MAG: hypothetical protein JXR03_15470 [Cyclobacteriaceae bacterium]